jgi:RNA polymerase-binding transcription factor DksA
MSDIDPDLEAPAMIDERVEATRFRVELDDVELALSRLDDGTYGSCQVCGTAIDDEVLSQQPQIRVCIEHSA